jgi:hypothetical protein
MQQPRRAAEATPPGNISRQFRVRRAGAAREHHFSFASLDYATSTDAIVEV